MNVTEILPPTDTGESLVAIDISIDEEADWYYEGRPIIREDILELFYQNLTFTEDRAFVIEWQDRRYLPRVADSPYVITRVDRREEGGSASFLLTLKHLKIPEVLDPETLRVGAHNVLYCQIKDGLTPARFSRPAYYQMAQWIDQDPESEQFFVELNGTRHIIR